MTKPDGGPAFPMPPNPPRHDYGAPGGGHFPGEPGIPGMSLRDYFAGQVAGALVASYPQGLPASPTKVAADAYRIADAMIAEREMPAFVDQRIVYGAACAWWGAPGEVGRLPGGRPCCPGCKGPISEVEDLEAWWARVASHERDGNGNRAFWEWLRFRHFKSLADASATYEEETGKPSGYGK